MRCNLHLFAPRLAANFAAIVLAAICWLHAPSAFAGDTRSATKLPPLPQQLTKADSKPLKKRGSVASPDVRLGPADEIATLHAIQTALISVGDGGAYVWRRGNGMLRALIQPTASFKSASGKICRHVVVRLMSGRYSRQTEGVACRNDQGAWSLSG